MRVFSAADVDLNLDDRKLIDALREAFGGAMTAPPRHHYTMPAAEGETDTTLLVMPAWKAGEAMGVKVVSVVPGNAQRDLPSIMGSYLLIDGLTGAPRAVLDGATLTARRTAAVSALAATYLARQDVRTHLVIGGGRLSAPMARSHRAFRPIERTFVWARRREQAESVVRELCDEGMDARIASDPADAAGRADIVSCVTMSETPVLSGAWLKAGTHVDLVGSYRPHMREADDAVMRGARIVADNLSGALEESGELRLPLESGVIDRSDLAGDLFDLSASRIEGRINDTQTTVFKSVGTSIADLATAQCVWDEAGDA